VDIVYIVRQNRPTPLRVCESNATMFRVCSAGIQLTPVTPAAQKGFTKTSSPRGRRVLHHCNALTINEFPADTTPADPKAPDATTTTPPPTLWRDGVQDDSPALNAILRGERVPTAEGRLVGCRTPHGTIRPPRCTYWVAGPVRWPTDREVRLDATLRGLGGYQPVII
jgi:hypothetical protein